MSHLSITVRCRDCVVDQRVCRLQDGLEFGDTDGAELPFPGTRVQLRRDRQGGWRLHGRPLHARAPVRVSVGDLEVSFELVPWQPMSLRGDWAHQMGLLLTVAATVLIAMWVETAQALVQHNPEFPDRLQAFIMGPPQAPTQAQAPYVAPSPNLDGWSPPVSFMPSLDEGVRTEQ